MVDRYYTWFLNNYTMYKYIGPKAKAVFDSISEYIKKNDPNIYNFNTVYASFMALYKGNIICNVKGANGIFPSKGNYYLLFEEDGVLVPLAYIEFYKRVSEIEIENIVRCEIKNREIAYDSLIGQKEVLVNKCDRLIRSSGNHTKEVRDAKINRFLFMALLLIPGAFIAMMFVDKVIQYFSLNAATRWCVLGMSIILALCYVLLTWGSFAAVSILQRGKKVNQNLYDLELKIHTNSKNLKSINIRKLVSAIHDGKKVQPPINDLDYKELFYKAEDNMEEIEKNKIIKSRIHAAIYQISKLVTVLFSSLIASLVFIHFMGSGYSFRIMTYMPFVSSIAILLISGFPIIKTFRSIRVRNIIFIMLIGALISVGIWYCLMFI